MESERPPVPHRGARMVVDGVVQVRGVRAFHVEIEALNVLQVLEASCP